MADVVCDLVLDRLAGAGPLDDYSVALRDACERAPPRFGRASFGDAFRRRARDPGWLAGLLLSDVDLEGYSARQLWRYANTLGPQHEAVAAAIRSHARDESRHARVFANLLLTLFPDLDRPELRDRMRAMTPDLGRERRLENPDDRPFDELVNTMALVNLFEIKALVLVRLLGPVAVAYCPARDRAKVSAMIDALAADEIEHIRYTAAFLDAASRAGYRGYVRAALADFQDTLNLTTDADLEVGA